MTCVECSVHAHCSVKSKKACSGAAHKCVQCTDDSFCGAGQVCDSASLSCVECVTDEDCAASSKVCNTALNKCVPCLTDNQCQQNPTYPVCNPQTNSCVECTISTECWLRDMKRPICDKNSCRPCKDNTDCTLASLYYGACDTGSGICVADQYAKGFYISAVVMGSIAVFLVIAALVGIAASAAR